MDASNITTAANNPDVLKAIVDYGLAIVGLYFITRFLAWLIKYILEENKKREDTHMALLTGDVRKVSESITAMVSAVNNFKLAVDEAHKYQREEHKEQIGNQGKVSEALVKVNDSLSQIQEALGRINGYKHD